MGYKAALVPSPVVAHGCSDAMSIKEKVIKMTPEEIILENLAARFLMTRPR